MFARHGPLIPREHRAGMARRLLIVLAVALLIGTLNWSMRPAGAPGKGGLDTAMVYSLSISLLTWMFIDVARFVLWRPLRAPPPDYWPPPLRAALLLAAGIAAGYLIGTALGDAYAGVSTWELLQLNPNRFTGLLLSSLAISVAFIAYFHQRGHGEAMARQVREAQLQLLQSQLEPHMLFNTLANLRVLIGVDPPRAQAMLDRLIAFLRATLSASRAHAASAGRRVRAPRRLPGADGACAWARGCSRSSTCPTSCARLPVPPLLLQPLVENSIKHGLEPKVAGGRIEVSARRDGDMLVLSVRDTGVGLAASAAARGDSRFGLQQVRERLQTLYGEPRHAWSVHGAAGGGTLALHPPAAASSMTQPHRADRRRRAPAGRRRCSAELARAVARAAGGGRVGDGAAALAQALALRPDAVLPGHPHAGPERPGGGAGAGRGLARRRHRHFPLLVFVTAYDQYALQAFDAQAVDYLVKPVDSARLAACVARLQRTLATRQGAGPGRCAPAWSSCARCSAPRRSAGNVPRLEVIQASVGAMVHMVPVDEVIYFEAADKYVRVVTAEREHLIRMSLRELLPQLDPQPCSGRCTAARWCRRAASPPRGATSPARSSCHCAAAARS